MEALLLGAMVFLFGLWFFGHVVGTGFSRALEPRSPETVQEPRLRSIGASYPARRETARKPASYPIGRETELLHAA